MDLKQLVSLLDKSKLYYLASPYRSFHVETLDKYWRLESAFEAAATAAGILAAEGIFTFSPIAHSHPVAEYSSLDGTKNEPWYTWNVMLMQRMDAMIVAQFGGWDESHGIRFEIDWFVNNNKEVHYLSL